MSDDFGKSLGDLLKAGVGALASAVEKGKDFVDDVTTEGTPANQRASELVNDLTRKGQETIEQTKSFGKQVKDKMVSAVCADLGEFDNLIEALDSFPREQLTAIKEKAEALLANMPDEPSEGCCCGCQEEKDEPEAPCACEAHKDEPEA